MSEFWWIFVELGLRIHLFLENISLRAYFNYKNIVIVLPLFVFSFGLVVFYLTNNSNNEKPKSSVLILESREKNNYHSDWKQSCTAEIISIKNMQYISTAAHCIKNDLPSGATSSTGKNTKKQNEYAVLLPNGKRVKLSAVKTIANTDWAIMRVKDYINILSVKTISFDISLPTIGQKAILSSYPGIADGKEVSAEGTYLGTLQDLSDNNWYQYVGIIHIYSPQEDPCNFGASGSSAVIGEQKYVTGPLSTRNNIGYPDGTIQPEDGGKNAITERSRLQKSLKTDLNPYITICEYSSINTISTQ